MALDLTKFAQPKRVVVPIHQGKFQFNYKRYRADFEDGWAENKPIDKWFKSVMNTRARKPG